MTESEYTHDKNRALDHRYPGAELREIIFHINSASQLLTVTKVRQRLRVGQSRDIVFRFLRLEAHVQEPVL